jgi:dihydroorotate dehydrogenase
MLYRRFLRPLLFRLPPERAHHLGAIALRVFACSGPLTGFLRRLIGHADPALRTAALGAELPSPVGLAAGFDKDARLFDGALAVGFGFVEIGTVTAHPQPGNEPPRLARLPADRALLNRFGFNNAGAAAAALRLGRRDRAAGLVGANVGKSNTGSRRGPSRRSATSSSSTSAPPTPWGCARCRIRRRCARSSRP